MDADARAQAGIAYTLGGDVTYESPIRAHSIWENTLSFSGTAYDGRGQNEAHLGGRTGFKYSPPTGLPSLWYGYVSYDKQWIKNGLGGPVFGEYLPYSTTTMIGMERHWQPADGRHGAVFGTYSIKKSGIGGQDARITRLGASYAFPLLDGTLSYGGYLEDTDSGDATIAAKTGNIGLGYDYRLPHPALDLSARFQFSHSRYKSQLFGYSDVRQDDALSLELDVTPQALQWYSFRPKFGVEILRNISNLERYDTREIRFFTEISSVF